MRRFRMLLTVALPLALLAFAPMANADIPHDGSSGWATVDNDTGHSYGVSVLPLYKTDLEGSGYGWIPKQRDKPAAFAPFMDSQWRIHYIYVYDICSSGFVWAWYDGKWWAAYANHLNFVPGYSVAGKGKC